MPRALEERPDPEPEDIPFFNAFFSLNDRRTETGSISLVEIKTYCEIIGEDDIEFIMGIIEVADVLYRKELEEIRAEKAEIKGR